MSRQPHYAGELAYFDAFVGLVPCKVMKVLPDKKPQTHVRIRITATRKTYKRGEELVILAPYVVPRTSIRCRNHQYCVVNDYEWCTENSDA